MHIKNRFLPLLMLIPIAACSDTGDDGPALDTAAEPAGTGSSEAIYLSDLDRSEPRSSLSREWKHGTWRLVDYTAERDADEIDIKSIHDAFRQQPDPGRIFSGTLLLAMHDSRAPEITYSLDRTGWHRIYIGIYQKPFEGTKAIDVRLSRDASFTTLEGHEGAKDHQENRLYEVYWKTADLTGQAMHFRQITFPRIRDAWVAFVKLVPLSEEQVRDFKADRRNPEHKRLFVHIDPGISNESGDEETLLSLLEPLRHGDVARLYWETGMGDRVFYASSIGRRPTETRDHGDDPDNPFYGRAYDGVESKTWRAYRETGVEPLEVAVEFAHEHGIELHAAYRVAGFHFPVPHYSETKGSFFEQHPELVCVDREGNPLPRISYAFPETRKYVLSLLRETASNYAIDGVALLYNRRPPLLAYEAPIVEGFQAEYGEDPRKLDSLDERWLRYRSTFLTRFMRELRAMLDEVELEQGRSRLAVTAVVCRPGENILHGMDLNTWVREGLVDTLIPYSSSVRLNSFVSAWDDPQDVEHFVSLVKGTDCTLALNMMPRAMTSREYYDMAYRLYQSGVERFFFWDGLGRTGGVGRWRRAARIGHRSEVEEWFKKGSPSLLPAASRLWILDGWDLRLETPG
ncbi:MAG: family 10 glycosylhydrolase [Candidatus Aminicenantes bacterium]|nr:family 10 glycosylhydrolase [Candidatus Aminicenantes bacterium]